jgi:hypothetical protein
MRTVHHLRHNDALRNYRRVWQSSELIVFGSARFESLPDTFYLENFRGFLQSHRSNSGIVPELGHGRFLPNPFQFVISFYVI